jgi:hypothetical protein
MIRVENKTQVSFTEQSLTQIPIGGLIELDDRPRDMRLALELRLPPSRIPEGVCINLPPDSFISSGVFLDSITVAQLGDLAARAASMQLGNTDVHIVYDDEGQTIVTTQSQAASDMLHTYADAHKGTVLAVLPGQGGTLWRDGSPINIGSEVPLTGNVIFRTE